MKIFFPLLSLLLFTYNSFSQTSQPDIEETVTWIGDKISKYSYNTMRPTYEDKFKTLSLNPKFLEYSFIVKEKEVIGGNSYTKDQYEVMFRIPISSLKKVSYSKMGTERYCFLLFESEKKDIEYINLTTGEKGFDMERAIQIHCDPEPNLESRLQKAFAHLKTFSPKPKKETF